MGKLIVRIASLLLIAAFLPTAVLAAEWNLENGSIEITATANAEGGTTQTVSQGGSSAKDSNPTITSKGKETNNTITIKAEDGTTANVTIKDANISTGSAAIKTEGKGDVNLNIEGTNTVSSGRNNAGVEKSNKGDLTIGSERGEGKLTANGGKYGAGIGGGDSQSGNDITITGGEIIANGGEYGAGIGGGWCGNGSDITISGGEVTANGGRFAAGIGGGWGGNGSDITISGGEVTANGGEAGAGIGGGYLHSGNDITISGGKVNATGGTTGAGIGGGFNGDGSDIAISKDSQVEAKGGAANGISVWGASIGCGGNYNGTPGKEVSPDTSGLYTTGKVERIRGDGTVLDTIVGTVEPPKSASSEEPDKREPLYRVLHLDGSTLKHQAQKADGVLALTVSADGAILTGTLRALGYLQNQGIEKITFTDGAHTATIVLADLIAKGEAEAVYVLTLGAANTLTLNGEAIDF